MSRGHVRPWSLVVSPSLARRTAFAQALEEHGLAVVEAGAVDEAYWALVAVRSGDAPPLDVVVLDLLTPGVRRLMAEVRSSCPSRRPGPGKPGYGPPALVLVGARPGDPSADVLRASDASIASAEVVAVPGRTDDLCAAVERALARRPGASRLRALVAIDGAGRRADVRQALAGRGACVVDVADGLELLEVLGANLALAPVAWVPEVLVIDARLERLDGVDALAEVRELDVDTPALLLADPQDVDARARAPRLRAQLLGRATPAAEVARATFAARPPSWRAWRPSRAA